MARACVREHGHDGPHESSDGYVFPRPKDVEAEAIRRATLAAHNPEVALSEQRANEVVHTEACQARWGARRECSCADVAPRLDKALPGPFERLVRASQRVLARVGGSAPELDELSAALQALPVTSACSANPVPEPDEWSVRDKADAEIIRRYWLRNWGSEPIPGGDDKDIADLQAAIDEARNDERRHRSETAAPQRQSVRDRLLAELLEARDEERAAIVKWLRIYADEAAQVSGPEQYEHALRNAADLIENGDWLATPVDEKSENEGEKR